MNVIKPLFRCCILSLVAALFLAGPLFAARDDVATPKEYGVYAKTSKGLKRILPNIVFDEEGVLYVESNNPQRFRLNDVQYFVIYGKYEMQYLTLNNLLFLNQSPLGKTRFIFGKELQLDVKKRNETLYSVKPKGLFGRGYYSLWINDSAWDFIIE
jgi:hypothetical protein